MKIAPDEDDPASVARWRFTTPADAPFLYGLALALDPRIWRVSRHGTAPLQALEAFNEYAASVTIIGEDGDPCGFAGLVNLSGTIRCAQLDLHASPRGDAIAQVRAVASEIVAAAFGGSPVEQLYSDLFEGDPDLLADVTCFRDDVVLPEFARIDDRLVRRTTRSTSRAEFTEWQAADT